MDWLRSGPGNRFDGEDSPFGWSKVMYLKYMYSQFWKNLGFQAGCAVLLCVSSAFGATHNVSVGSFFFNPANVTIDVNDSVQWTFTGAVGHTSTHNGNPPLWNSGTRSGGQTFT